MGDVWRDGIGRTVARQYCTSNPRRAQPLPVSTQRHKTRARGGRLAGIFWEREIAHPRQDDAHRQVLGPFEALDGIEMREHLIVQHPQRAFERGRCFRAVDSMLDESPKLIAIDEETN